MLKFTEDHEWLKIEGDVATVGITEHAAEQLGDLVFVELPEVGAKLDKGGEASTVESVKAASDVYCPLAGEITESQPGDCRRSVAGQFGSDRRGLVLQAQTRQSQRRRCADG